MLLICVGGRGRKNGLLLVSRSLSLSPSIPPFCLPSLSFPSLPPTLIPSASQFSLLLHFSPLSTHASTLCISVTISLNYPYSYYRFNKLGYIIHWPHIHLTLFNTHNIGYFRSAFKLADLRIVSGIHISSFVCYQSSCLTDHQSCFVLGALLP